MMHTYRKPRKWSRDPVRDTHTVDERRKPLTEPVAESNRGDARRAARTEQLKAANALRIAAAVRRESKRNEAEQAARLRILAKSAGDSGRSRPLGLIEAGRAFW